MMANTVDTGVSERGSYERAYVRLTCTLSKVPLSDQSAFSIYIMSKINLIFRLSQATRLYYGSEIKQVYQEIHYGFCYHIALDSY